MACPEAFQPLRITAHLRVGIVCDRWLPLDAILLYQTSRQQNGTQVATVAGGEPESMAVTMPLRVIHPGEPHWYYACSWAQPQPWWVAEGRDYWNKRLDIQFAHLIDFGKKRGKVQVGKGRYKAYHMPVFYYAAEQVMWYCVGDQTGIECLLSTVTHIGKKRSQGWGRVVQWKVESWLENWSVWCDGELTRGVPVQDAGQSYKLLYYGVRPSYYRQQNQIPLAMPDG